MLALGIDVGTTAVKAMFLDGDGRIAAKGRAEYPLRARGRPGRVEQDAADWWRATVDAVRRALPAVDASRVAAVAVSAQGASSCLVDAAGAPLGPALTWMDTRAARECEHLIREKGEAFFYRRTGWKPSPALDAAKAMWLARHEPDAWRRAARFVSTPDYLNFRLCGQWAIDPSAAAIRQLFNLEALTWDDEILALASLSPDKLPRVRPAGECLGGLKPAAAAELGLPPATRVYNGAHDQYCAAFGSGVVSPGRMLIATGTAWALFGLARRPVFSDAFIAPAPYALPGLWGGLASLSGAGAALAWLAESIGEDSLDALCGGAAVRRAAGLHAYPYFNGAPFPFWRPEVKASFLGLELGHDKHDLALALMEGVVFHLRDAVEAYARAGFGVESLRLSGGAANNKLWLSLVAANMDRPVEYSDESDRSALGAACLAGIGCGLLPGPEAAGKAAAWRAFPEPSREEREHYREKYARHAEAWPHLARAAAAAC